MPEPTIVDGATVDDRIADRPVVDGARGRDPEVVARECAERMYADDQAIQALGIRLEAAGPGSARLSMTVRREMVNGQGACHGGVIATLADSAFAIACNSRGVFTVAAGFDINFLEPALLYDVLTAEAREVSLRGRSGIYDVTVRRGEHVIAEFRGRSRSSKPPTPKEDR